MTSTSTSDMLFSEFTLAFLQDTGFYQVNMTLAEPFYFLKKSGCDLFNKGCKSTIQTDWFCYNPLEFICTTDGSSQALCSQDKYSPICNFKNEHIPGNCRNPLNIKTNSAILGEVYSNSSKCFLSTVVKKGNTYKNQTTSSCFQAIVTSYFF